MQIFVYLNEEYLHIRLTGLLIKVIDMLKVYLNKFITLNKMIASAISYTNLDYTYYFYSE